MSPSSLRRPRRALPAVVASLLAGVLGLVALPAAQAANPGLDPANRIGDVTLTPTSGALSTAGDPSSLTTSVGCPEGFRGSSRVIFVWEDGTMSAKRAGSAIAVPTAGSGLDGQPVSRTGSGAAQWGTIAFPISEFRTGLATYVVTCELDSTSGTAPSASAPVGEAKYFSTDIQVDAAAGTWRVADGAPVEKVDTTTTLTPAANSDGTVTLTAAVSSSTATGDMVFTDLGAGTSKPSVPVVNGSASLVVTDLDAGKEYRYQAVYAGDAQHNGSTSNEAVVTTVAAPVPPVSTDVTVTIPAAAGGLTLSVTPGGVALSQATLQGTDYVASGTLGTVTVSDRRTTRTPWTLNGSASAFTVGTNTFSSSALGWTPTLVGDAAANGGTAGRAVTPGTDGGLSTTKPLAQAAAGVTVADTTVQAALALKVASSSVAAGTYTSQLTLTLI